MRVPLLSVENLSLEFRTRSGVVRALERVSLSVFKGETVGVVGESGSGKSVTAYAIMGLLDAAAAITSGHIVFGGLDVTAASEEVLQEVRGREVSMIFQNPRTELNPTRPIGRQIEDVLLRHHAADNVWGSDESGVSRSTMPRPGSWDTARTSDRRSASGDSRPKTSSGSPRQSAHHAQS